MRIYHSTTPLLLLAALLGSSQAFQSVARSRNDGFAVLRSSNDDAAAFSNFAASLQQPPKEKSSTSSTTATATKQQQQERKWQDDLDELLDPFTSVGRRQILLSELLQANAEIRSSVEAALRDGKIDPLLTPTGKKWQDGTRAVARQLTNDILPSLRSTTTPFNILRPPKPQDLEKVGSRLFSALQNQVQSNLETLQGDLQNPSRIPERLSQQTEEFVKEASNVFMETPVGLKEPEYTVVATYPDYEIREYAGYKVATTNMGGEEESYDIGQAGAAFNSLAAYLFGANEAGKSMSMTTPVQTTMSGEMRFYLDDGELAPDPLQNDQADSVYETGSILLEDIPPARLAVRRFTGFCTQGEIARQKEALLAALSLDDAWTVDVPHGQTVRHVLFQYNPPYTLPVLRRNEIAVPVLLEEEESNISLERQWTATDEEELPGTDY